MNTLAAVQYLNLNDFIDWNPSVLLAPDPGSLWPVEARRTIAELTSKVLPSEGVEGPLISPRDVDFKSGGITVGNSLKTGWTYSLEPNQGLREGDLLVSRDRPSILVTSAVSGLQFSTLFSAIRPRQGVDSLWLWACLNSSFGVAVREAATSGGTIPRLDLGRVPIPELMVGWEESRASVAALVNEVSAILATQDRGESWWRSTSLPGGQSWAPLLAAPDPSIFDVGVRLGDLIGSVAVGRRLGPEPSLPGELLPVWGIPQLRGRAVTAFAPREAGVIAEADCILIPRTGSRGAAAMVTVPCLADSSLLVVSLSTPSLAPAVVAALNSPAGQRQRAFRTVGSAIPQLQREGLNEMRLELDDVESLEHPVLEALSTRIDRMVWS